MEIPDIRCGNKIALFVLITQEAECEFKMRKHKNRQFALLQDVLGSTIIEQDGDIYEDFEPADTLDLHLSRTHNLRD